ncbi:MAG: hypothetical protein ACI8UD_004344 [Planctomycetota bacterium]|jgi:hypothetical protein
MTPLLMFRMMPLLAAVVLVITAPAVAAPILRAKTPPAVLVLQDPGGEQGVGEKGRGEKEPSEKGPSDQGKAELSKEAKAEAALGERLDKAIAAYEKVREDPKKLSQRKRLLGWIGEIDHPRATEYLKKDLNSYASKRAGEYSVDAIAKVARPDLEPALLNALKRADSTHRVRVKATRLLAMLSDDACDDLIDYAATVKNAQIRAGLLEGLSTCESPKVHRELAQLILAGDHAFRLGMLIATRQAKGVRKIDDARIKCIKEGNLIVAATAWRLLVEQGHRRGKDLTIDVLERVFDKPDAAAATELVQGLVLVGDADFFPAILRFGATRGNSVKQALRRVAGAAGKNADLIEFLIEEGIEAESPGERSVAKILLSKAPAAAVAPLVARIRKQLKRNRKKVLESAAGLHDLLAKDPTWVQDLARLAVATDFESRMLGLAMLLEMDSPAAITAAQRYLKNRAWELRSLSYRYLTKSRDVTSIPLLIARFGKEEGRLEHELNTALFKHTGTRCWTTRDWSAWWRSNKVGFALPHPKSVKGGGSSAGGNTVSYYDIPLVSSRIAFIVDHSGSMGASVGTDKKRNRLMAAKEQLRQVIGALPKTHKVNLVPFESGVAQVWRELKALNNNNRRELLDKIDKIKLAGGTNTYGAIMAAMEDPEVDTIYLLTDGVPTAGEVIDTEEILEAVMRKNRTRQIIIHCISIGMKSELLMDLAALTGGQYKEVR